MDWTQLINGPVGILAALVALIGFYFGGRRAGRKDSDREHEAKRAEEAVKQVREFNDKVKMTNEIRQANADRNADSVRQRMRDKYRSQ